MQTTLDALFIRREASPPPKNKRQFQEDLTKRSQDAGGLREVISPVRLEWADPHPPPNLTQAHPCWCASVLPEAASPAAGDTRHAACLPSASLTIRDGRLLLLHDYLPGGLGTVKQGFFLFLFLQTSLKTTGYHRFGFAIHLTSLITKDLMLFTLPCSLIQPVA